jgi:hypothetical protein
MKTNLKYLKAPLDWGYSGPNPFTSNGEYGSDWIAFCILDEDHDQIFTGKSGKGPFSARFGRQVPNIPERLVDFLKYENTHGRRVILSFPSKMDVDEYVTQVLASTPDSNIVRPEDPAILIHATTQVAWKSIKADGALKATSQLAKTRDRSGGETKVGQIEAYLYDEPPEYKDYIMFGGMDSCAPEMVLASTRAGKFILDERAVFEPGVRLYLDNYRIIHDGLATRDGLHVNKVHLHLPLEPYLLFAVGVDDLDPQRQVKEWTIRNFVERANTAFRKSGWSDQSFKT